MLAIAPELKSRWSDSTPSEKITPPAGIWDSSASGALGSTAPATIDACECRLTKGSRTTKKRRSSSHSILTGLGGVPPRNARIPDVWLKMDESQPVLPAPVDTMIPLDEWFSRFSPWRIR